MFPYERASGEKEKQVHFSTFFEIQFTKALPLGQKEKVLEFPLEHPITKTRMKRRSGKKPWRQKGERAARDEIRGARSSGNTRNFRLFRRESSLRRFSPAEKLSPALHFIQKTGKTHAH